MKKWTKCEQNASSTPECQVSRVTQIPVLEKSRKHMSEARHLSGVMSYDKYADVVKEQEIRAVRISLTYTMHLYKNKTGTRLLIAYFDTVMDILRNYLQKKSARL